MTAPPTTTAALAELVDAVAQLAGLTRQVGAFALGASTVDETPELVAAVCAELGVPLRFDVPGDGPDHAVTALAARIRRAQQSPGLAGLAPADAAATSRRLHDEARAGLREHAVRRPDGTVLTVVAAGPPDAPGVLLSAPPGLDHRLSLPWLRALAGDRHCGDLHCVVLETRGTSEPITDPADFDRRGSGLDSQVDDLLAVAAELADGPVHLMGLCGGVAVALAAAAARPDLVGSVSAWHADLELGPDVPKSDQQENLRAVLDVAGESRDTAAWLRGRLTSGPMTGVPEEVGPLVVRPYATPELFYRYARLTAAGMRHDSRPAAAALAGTPCLVVTSEDDATTHPAGSRRLAELVPGARLVTSPHGTGTHLDAFRASADHVAALRSFLADPEREIP